VSGPLGIVIVDHGSRRAESNQLFERFVELFRASTDHEIVELAHMELAEPGIETALLRCVERGARRVLVAPYFLAPGRHWAGDLSAQAAAAAAKASARVEGEVSWLVGQPIGLHPGMVTIIEERIEACLAHARGENEGCPACAGTDRCQFRQGPPTT